MDHVTTKDITVTKATIAGNIPRNRIIKGRLCCDNRLYIGRNKDKLGKGWNSENIIIWNILGQKNKGKMRKCTKYIGESDDSSKKFSFF